MLTAFYVLVGVCTVFVILSLAVVRSHEKSLAEREASLNETSDLPKAQEEEFFRSPIYKAMYFIAKM